MALVTISRARASPMRAAPGVLLTVDLRTVLAIAGGADLIAPPALMRLWVAHVPGAELAEAGHAMAWRTPRRSTP